MSDNPTRSEQIAKLNDLIKDVRIAMMTTVEDDGSLRSRPMATQQSAFDSNLWFFTRDDSGKVDEVGNDRHVNLSYANPDKQSYVSISGTATLTHDKAKMEELWNPIYKAWFPDGLDDPQIALLSVSPTEAEYWDSSSSKMVNLFQMVKGAVTGKEPDMGENERIQL